ncbi:hypothetical protein D3C80_820620 [compost metagenome]
MALAGIIFLHDISPERYSDYRAMCFTLASAGSARVLAMAQGGSIMSDANKRLDGAKAVMEVQFGDLENATHFVEVYRNVLDADDNVLEQQFLYAMAIQAPPILRRPEMLTHLYRMCDLRLQHEPDYFIYDIKSIGELAK